MKPILIAVSVLTIAIVAGSVMYSASSSRTASERKLLRLWSAPASSVEERAEAVNRCFPRGTPISSIIAVLGTNHTALRRVATANRGKYSEDAFTLTYGFGGGESVIIQAWVRANADPLGGAFSGARGLIWEAPGARTQTTNTREDQQSIEATGKSRLSRLAFVSLCRLPPVAHARR